MLIKEKMKRKFLGVLPALLVCLCGCRGAVSDEHAVLLEVPFIDQRIQYPTGCECVSAVMALQYLGYEISVDTFIDDYMEKGELPRNTEEGKIGPDPDRVFLGNPYTSEGYGCYAGAIQLGLERYLSEERPERKLYESAVLRDVPVEELAETYLKQGIPVIFWVGPRYEEDLQPEVWTDSQSGKTITWNYPEHCVVLVGYDQEHYYFNDPSRGAQVAWEKEDARAKYANQFSQAVVILPLSEK